jgi:ligand-binding sensor domain-containing protein/two-component sensor histidine kinase
MKGRVIKTFEYFCQPKKGLWLFLFFIGVTALNAQQLNFKNYTDDVLPTANIYTAFEDSRGYMWFGSDRGVIRYDGYLFTSFTKEDGLSDNEVFNFYEDRKGRIWLETMNGKMCYYKDGIFWNAKQDSVLAKMDCDASIHSIREDKHGNIWIISNRDIVCYKTNGTVTRVRGLSPFGQLVSLVPLSDGTFALSAEFKSFRIKFNPMVDSVIEADEFKSAPVVHNRGTKHLLLSDNEVMFKDEHRLSIVNFRDDSSHMLHKFPPDIKPLSLSRIGQDDIWVGTTDGIVRFSLKKSKAVEVLLKKHAVTSAMCDREGNYWFTTVGHGIFFCTSMEMKGYTSQNGLLVDRVNTLARNAHGKVWLGYGPGSGGYMSFINAKGIGHVRLTDDPRLRNLETLKINCAADSLLVSTSVGAFIVTPNKIGVIYDYTRNFIEHPAGTYWRSSANYIYTISKEIVNKRLRRPVYSDYVSDYSIPRTAVFEQYYSIKLHGPRAKSFLIGSNGVFWVGTDRGLYYYENDSLYAVGHQEAGLTSIINDIAELRDKTIVAATNDEGIIIMRDRKHVMSLGTENGLSSNICNAIDVDNDGAIWVATSKGLNKISGYPDSLHVDYYNEYDGLLTNDIADVLLVNDTVWIATRKGVTFFHKDHIIRRETAPLMYIEKVTSDAQPVFFNNESILIFKHNQNNIGIRYVGLLYGNGDPLLYRYRLHDGDPWRYTKSTSVYLPELNPDEYEFAVAAQGRSGKWSEEATIRFQITKPFWKTAGFIVIMVLLMLAIISGLIQKYIADQRKEMLRQQRVVMSELKTLRAQMNPHFLFNALNSIQGVLLKKDWEGAQEYLSRFGKLMRLILDHSDRATITIKEELDSIVNYLEIEQLRANHQFQYRIEFDAEVDIEKSEIPAMILQPFIENSIWHGFGHRRNFGDLLVIRFGKSEGNILITTTDNGIGRRKAAELRKKSHKSKGIHLVKERIEILNFGNDSKISLEIEDLEDEQGNHPGTRVTIKIPVHEQH